MMNEVRSSIRRPSSSKLEAALRLESRQEIVALKVVRGLLCVLWGGDSARIRRIDEREGGIDGQLQRRLEQ